MRVRILHGLFLFWKLQKFKVLQTFRRAIRRRGRSLPTDHAGGRKIMNPRLAGSSRPTEHSAGDQSAPARTERAVSKCALPGTLFQARYARAIAIFQRDSRKLP